jgi:hypothetical protein
VQYARSHQSAGLAFWNALNTITNAMKYPEKEAVAFVGLLEEAGWTVSGSFVNENIAAEGLQIGVQNLQSPCPSARLLMDVLVSVGLSVNLVRAPESLCLLMAVCCRGPSVP